MVGILTPKEIDDVSQDVLDVQAWANGDSNYVQTFRLGVQVPSPAKLIGGANVINWTGDWLVITNYNIGDAVGDLGSSYVANTANVGDQPPSANWDLMAEKGDVGPGSGDMLAANNLSDVANASTSRTNLGLGAAAVEDVAAGGSGDLLRADGDGSSLTGITVIGGATDAEVANITENSFRIAVGETADAFNVANGTIDVFSTENGIDIANSTNETYDAVNDLYTNGGVPVTDNIITYAVEDSGMTDRAVRVLIAASEISTSGGQVSLELTGPSTVGQIIDLMYIAEQAAAGNWWDYEPGTKVQITFDGGSSSKNMGTGFTTVTTDTIAFTVDETKNYVVGYDGGTGDRAAQGALASAKKAFWNSTDNAATDAPVSPNNDISGNIGSVSKITVTPAALDMTLLSVPSTSLAQPDEAIGVLWEEDVDAVTINTDLLFWATREAGVTFTTDFGTDDKLDVAGHPFANDDRVMVTSSAQDLPAGLDAATVYYVISSATNDFEVSLTSGGGAVDITDDGTGVHTVRRWAQGTLELMTTQAVGQTLFCTADLTGLSAGTTIRYAIVTMNTKELKAHGISEKWG